MKNDEYFLLLFPLSFCIKSNQIKSSRNIFRILILISVDINDNKEKNRYDIILGRFVWFVFWFFSSSSCLGVASTSLNVGSRSLTLPSTYTVSIMPHFCFFPFPSQLFLLSCSDGCLYLFFVTFSKKTCILDCFFFYITHRTNERTPHTPLVVFVVVVVVVVVLY